MIQLKHRLIATVALLLGMLALYTPYLNRVMFCDEANTLYVYSQDLARALLSYATPNNHMLHSALLWLVTNLAGTSAPVVRFIALAGAMLSVALMFRVAGKIAGLRAAVAASVFLITTLAFADFAINARGYTLSVALTLLLIDRLFLTKNVWTRGYRYSLLLICFALILLLPSMLMLIAAGGVWVLWRARAQRRYLSLLPPMIVGVGVAGIFYVPSFMQGLFSQHINEFGENDLLVLLRLWLEQTFSTPVIGLIFAASCVAGAIVLVRRYPRARAILVTVLAVTALVAVVQLLVLHKLFFARNYLFLVAPVALLAGIGFSAFARRWTLPLMALVLVASVIPLRALDGDYLEKQVVALVEQNVGEHDQILCGPCFNAPVQHYLLHNEQGYKLFPSPDKERVFVLLREGTVDDVLALYDMQDKVTGCQPITDGSWGSFEVYTCQPQHA
jgi:hypothetical protein